MLSLLPTDTCYGLAGDFIREDYLEIYRLKGRDFSKPLALLIRDFADMREYIEISDKQIDFLKSYPYPWSFLGLKKENVTLPEFMDSGRYRKLSLRIASVCLKKHERSFHFPLFLTSANPSGGSEAKTFSEAREYFPGVIGFDGGVCDHPPSDIIFFDENGEIGFLRRNYGI